MAARLSAARLLALVASLTIMWACGSPTSAPLPSPAGTTALAPGDFTAELNGIRLWYRVVGKGPVAIMPTPAWGPGSDLYFRTLKPLEDYFTVVYLDSRGTGRSAKAPAPAEYTWQQLVGDLEALRMHLNQEKVWLMGHSEGGAQVLHYSVSHPERVSGLVLLASLAASTTAEDADMAARLARRSTEPWFEEAARSLQAPPENDEQFAANLARALPFYWSDPAKIAQYVDHFAATNMSAAAAQGTAASGRYPFDIRARLSVVTAPALIVVGDDDFICSPLAAQEMHLGLAQSKLLLIENSGHFPWLEQSEVFFREVPRYLRAMGLRPV